MGSKFSKYRFHKHSKKSKPLADFHRPAKHQVDEPESTCRLARSTPQWQWPHIKCVAWIQAVLIHYLDHDLLNANEIVRGFVGDGETLWMKKRVEWVELLGERDGEFVEELLGRLYVEDAGGMGVPEDVRVEQYEVMAVEERGGGR